jgi:hypothetical protein
MSTVYCVFKNNWCGNLHKIFNNKQEAEKYAEENNMTLEPWNIE